MQKQGPVESFNKFIFELRYKPNARMLDFRGSWAESISEHMQLSEWTIIENRIDVYSKDARNRAFVGFGNSGFVTNDVPSKNYFEDQAVKFIKFVLGLKGFDTPLFVNRLGIRSMFFRPFEGKFVDLLERYATRFLCMTKDVVEIMKAELTDIGGPLVFKGVDCNFTTMSGPMKEDQAKQFLQRSDKLPDVGLYFDIDYWKKPEQLVPNNDILEFVARSSKESWDKYERIAELLFKD